MQFRILIADREREAMQLLSAAAAHRGHSTWLAHNGIETIDRVKSIAPDLVIVDSLLRRVDGVRVAAKVRELEPGRAIPIVLTSAIVHSPEERAALRRRAGIVRVLAKPFTLEEAEAVLAAELEAVPEGTGAGDRLAMSLGQGGATPEPIVVGRLARRVAEAYAARATGVLTVRSGDGERILLLRQGRIVSARSSVARERLGPLLLRCGHLSEEEYRAASALVEHMKGSLSFDRALIDLRFMREEQRAGALRAQVTAIAIGALRADSGSFGFEALENLPAHQEITPNTAEVLLWVLRQLERQVDFDPYLPAAGSTLKVELGGEHQHLLARLSALEEQVLGLIQDGRPAREILSIGQLGQVDVARVLYAFVSLGMVVPSPPAEPDPEPEVEDIEIPRDGTVAAISPLRLIGRVWRARLSGVLHLLRRDDDWGRLCFDRGQLVWATSSRPEHRLGDRLARAGMLTEDDRHTAVALQSWSPERRLGSVLLDLKLLTLSQLDTALREQIRDILRVFLQWTEGRFVVDPGSFGTDHLTLGGSTADLLLECARSVPVPPELTAAWSDSDALLVVVWSEQELARLKVEADERRLIGALGGGKAPGEIRDLDLMEEPRVLRLVAALLAIDAVKLLRVPAADRRQMLAATAVERRTQSEDWEDVPLAASVEDPSLRPDELAVRLAQRCETLEVDNARLRGLISRLEAIVGPLEDVLAEAAERAASASAADGSRESSEELSAVSDLSWRPDAAPSTPPTKPTQRPDPGERTP